jgi:hypothetical protein
MTLRETEYWLRAAQIECQRTVYRQIMFSLVGIVVAWASMGVVVGTLNPLLLFNPDFQPSFAVRFWCLWSIATLCSASARAVYLATMKSHELRLGLHPSSTYLNQSLAPDALFFESEKNQ